MTTQPQVRIKVQRDGRICFDGSPVTLAGLRKALAEARKARKRIRYYREASRSEASRKALAVWEAVMDSGLPVELCDDEAQFRGDLLSEALGLPKEEKADDDVWWG